MLARAQLDLPFETSGPPAGPALPAPGIRYVRRGQARRYRIRVDRDGTALVTIPRGGSRREAVAFVRRSEAWIARQRARVRARALPPEEAGRLRDLAAAVLPARLFALAAAHGLTVGRVSIRDPKARWGSCGRDGHICLNWRLVRMPDWVRDYVLIHELMHLREMNHSPRYWALVEAACPHVHDARLWLRTHGDALSG